MPFEREKMDGEGVFFEKSGNGAGDLSDNSMTIVRPRRQPAAFLLTWLQVKSMIVFPYRHQTQRFQKFTSQSIAMRARATMV